MDVYTEGSTLHMALVGKVSGKDGNSIAYLVSKDAGRSWSEPVIVNHAEDGAVMSRRGNEAQVAALGRRILVAWRRGGGELPDAGPIVTAYSEDGGKTWHGGGQSALGDATENQSYPDLAVDAKGRFHVVWLDDREERGNTQGLRYARSEDGGRHWLGEATLDPQVCTCCWNRLVALPGHGLAVLYRDDEPHDMRLARQVGKRPWRSLSAVGAFDWRFNGCPHCGGGIAAGPGQRLHGVVWSGKDGAEGLYYLNSQDLGGHWSPPLRVGDQRSRESDVAALADGRVGVVFAGPWGQGEGVQLIESDDQGKTWSNPKLLSAEGAAADHPRILATPKGFRVFWTEKRPGEGRVWAMYSLEKPRKP